MPWSEIKTDVVNYKKMPPRKGAEMLFMTIVASILNYLALFFEKILSTTYVPIRAIIAPAK